MSRIYSNLGGGTLSAPISANATSLPLGTGQGSSLPNPALGEFFDVVIQQTTTSPIEVVRCTARSGDVLTTTPTANAYTAGALVDNRLTAEALVELQQARDNVAFSSPLIWQGAGGTDSVVYADGGAGPFGDGTVTARAVTTDSLFGSQRRVSRVSVAAPGSNAGWNGTATFSRGSVAGAGGFVHIAEWGISDAAAVPEARLFVGMMQNTMGNVNPSTLLNIVGVGADSSDTALSVMHNDAAGSATKVSLGANFPANTRNTDWYRTEIYADPNSPVIRWRVTRRNTGHTAEGTITTKLPQNTAMLYPLIRRNNGTSALSVGIDLGYSRKWAGLP
jgi:hypothetical protein